MTPRGVAGFMQNRFKMMEEMKKRRKQSGNSQSFGTPIQRSGLTNTLNTLRTGIVPTRKK